MKAAAGLLAAMITVLLGVTAGAAVLASAGAATAQPPSATALAEIPPAMLAVYQQAATMCEGLPWSVLAAVGWVESRHGDGHIDPYTGQVSPPVFGPPLDGQDGRSLISDPASADGYAHALGPMQFLPATWTEWQTLAPGRPAGAVADPQNAWDAAYTAARMLCGGRSAIGDIPAAVFGYNHSTAYVEAVLAKAAAYLDTTSTAALVDIGPGQTFSGDAANVIAFALAQLGVPYLWGGTIPGVGLDCSGLVVVSYRAAGINLPRTTFEQATLGVSVPLANLQPGDLLFFRGGQPAHDLGHVTIYAGNGLMVTAPHTGAVVSLEPVPYPSVQLARRVLTAP
jgi:cell wall-associated NlpC family hydrolase